MAIGRIIDISSNNHRNLPPGVGPPIDWNAVARAGVTAVFVKATEGIHYINPWLQADLVGAQAAGLDTSTYHFAQMGDPVAEAEFYMQQAGSLARVLDYETNTSVPWARSFLHTLGLPIDELLTYGSASTLSGIYQQLPSRAWPAAYNQGYPGWGIIWQFTSSAQIPGIVGDVDENRWYGTQAQYDATFAPAIPQPLPAHKEETMTAVVIQQGGVQKVVIYAAGAGNATDHLLEFTRQPGTQTNDVRDITTQIGLTANNGGPFLVQA